MTKKLKDPKKIKNKLLPLIFFCAVFLLNDANVIHSQVYVGDNFTIDSCFSEINSSFTGKTLLFLECLINNNTKNPIKISTDSFDITNSKLIYSSPEFATDLKGSYRMNVLLIFLISKLSNDISIYGEKHSISDFKKKEITLKCEKNLLLAKLSFDSDNLGNFRIHTKNIDSCGTGNQSNFLLFEILGNRMLDNKDSVSAIKYFKESLLLNNKDSTFINKLFGLLTDKADGIYLSLNNDDPDGYENCFNLYSEALDSNFRTISNKEKYNKTIYRRVYSKYRYYILKDEIMNLEEDIINGLDTLSNTELKADANYLKGNIYFHKGNYDKAENYYKKVFADENAEEKLKNNALDAINLIRDINKKK
jgi:hypothetical protein